MGRFFCFFLCIGKASFFAKFWFERGLADVLALAFGFIWTYPY
jgi:hypothetical protein